jgi:hypothetical protein
MTLRRITDNSRSVIDDYTPLTGDSIVINYAP